MSKGHLSSRENWSSLLFRQPRPGLVDFSHTLPEGLLSLSSDSSTEGTGSLAGLTIRDVSAALFTPTVTILVPPVHCLPNFDGSFTKPVQLRRFGLCHWQFRRCNRQPMESHLTGKC
jgi:hypothetical protein